MHAAQRHRQQQRRQQHQQQIEKNGRKDNDIPRSLHILTLARELSLLAFPQSIGLSLLIELDKECLGNATLTTSLSTQSLHSQASTHVAQHRTHTLNQCTVHDSRQNQDPIKQTKRLWTSFASDPPSLFLSAIQSATSTRLPRNTLHSSFAKLTFSISRHSFRYITRP